MKAKIGPLDGKYYGTIIDIHHDEYDEDPQTISLWYNHFDNGVLGVPSPRELGLECHVLQWVENMWLPDVEFAETGEMGVYAQDFYQITCMHYENLTTYLAALKVVDALNTPNPDINVRNHMYYIQSLHDWITDRELRT